MNKLFARLWKEEDGVLAFEVTPAAPKPKKGKGGRAKAVAKA